MTLSIQLLDLLAPGTVSAPSGGGDLPGDPPLPETDPETEKNDTLPPTQSHGTHPNRFDRIFNSYGVDENRPRPRIINIPYVSDERVQ